jgi:hypothetical protein
MSKCIDCNKIALYNYEHYNKAIYCIRHKYKNMVNIKKNTCIYDDCCEIPLYNYQKQPKGMYCKNHKMYKMIKYSMCAKCTKKVNNLCANLYCENCLLKAYPERIKCAKCSRSMTTGYDGYCAGCFVDLFPEISVKDMRRIQINYSYI